jgi:DNA modification methylase
MELMFNQNDIKVYKGDNYELLKSLKTHSINLIYCDILYNSGKIFTGYSDDLGSPQEAIEWYRPRIKEMYRVLKKDGSIYIHCNWRLDSYMRILLDEIFGFNNFRNRIYRKHSEERGFVENYDSQMDVILYYVKDKFNFTFNEIKSKFPRIVPLVEDGILKERSDSFSYKKISFNPREGNKHWLIPPQKLIELYDKGELIMVDGIPCRKTYVVPIGNLWDSKEMLDSYSRISPSSLYDTPKPEAILERIIKVSSNEGDTVADFFMGGGTTALETLRLKRSGIFCDISQNACEVTVKKLSDEMSNYNLNN